MLFNEITDSIFNEDKPSTLNFRCKIQIVFVSDSLPRMVDEVIIKGNSEKTISVGKLGEIIKLFSKTIYRGSFASEYHPQSFFSVFQGTWEETE